MASRKVRISRHVRERVSEQAGYQCGYCKTSQGIAGYRLTIDHIIPEARGGTNLEENLWLACVACNQYKSARVRARDPKTQMRVRLFNPRHQEWHAHFRWSADGIEIIGLTPCGRATVLALQLNRPEMVGARWLWVQAGWWPPKL